MSENEKAVATDEKLVRVDQDYSFEAVPETSRKGFWNMFFIMLGFTFFSASMSVGAKMGNGLNLSGFIGAVVVGGVILSAYCGILAYIGADTGLSIDLLARRAFGLTGSKLPSLVQGLTQIGWFGVGVAMFAIPAAEVLHCNPWILVVVAGACMTCSAYFGMKSLAIVSYISVPLIAILGTYSMVTAARAGGGLEAIFAAKTGLPFFAAVGMVIGSFISGGTSTPNFVRFSKNTKIAIVTTVIAFFIGNSLMFAFGAVGGAFTGAEDIFYVMMAQGLLVPALIVLGANIWTTNDNALYTGGLGFSNITGIRKKPLVIVAGIIGTAASMWLYWNFVGWLNFLNVALPPIGITVMLDFFRNREKYAPGSKVTRKVNWFTVLGLIAGALAGNLIPWGVAAINSMIVAAIFYFIGEAVYRGK